MLTSFPFNTCKGDFDLEKQSEKYHINPVNEDHSSTLNVVCFNQSKQEV